MKKFMVIISIIILSSMLHAQYVQQGNKLVGTDAVGNARQGHSVSISGDGNTLLTGGTGDNSNAGAAWVYTRINGVWSQQGTKLVGTDAAGAAFQGLSVSLSADGNTAVIGGPYDNNNKGAAWVFTRTNGVWTQQGNKLVGSSPNANSRQGFSVAVSADGNTIISGGASDDNSKAAVWVFTRQNGVWTQQGSKLVGTGATGGSFQGISLAISADGNTIIAGDNWDNGIRGAAWVYIRQNGVWTQQGNKLVGSDCTANACMGWSAAISDDGNTAILGGWGDNNSVGAAWVFTRQNGVWSQQGNKLVGTGTTGTAIDQGYSVALSADGSRAVVGGCYDFNGKGASWVFSRQNGVWTQLGNKLFGSPITFSQAFQGNSVSISDNSSTVAVGGPVENNSQGAVWVFTMMSFNITASAGANGTISPSGSVSVNNGSSQTYTIQANAGYRVQDVLVDGVSQGAITTYTFANVTADHTISATFAENIDNSITVPVIIYPANGIMVYTNSPVINWYTLKWVPSLKYRIQVASDPAFTAVVYDRTNISAQYTFLSGLSSGTQYYARVRGVSASGSTGAWSQTATFRTVTAPGQIPLVPTLIYPAGGATVLTDQPVIVWYISAYGPGLKYNLQLSTASDFSNIVVNQTNITNTTYNASGLSAGSTYYARVRSYTPQGLYSAFSPVESFTVNQLYGTQALTPVIVYPSGGSTVFATSFALTWTVPGYAPNQTLHLQVSSRSDFATFVVNQENLTGSSYVLNGLTYGTTYYARIRGKSQSGSYSLFSDIVPFTVVSENWLVSPLAGSPVEEVELTTAKALLSWYTPSAEALSQVRYDLQVSSDAGFTQVQNINGIISPSYELEGLKSSSKYYWRVRSRREDGKISPYSNEGVFVTAKELKVTGVTVNKDNVPQEYALRQNYPNPFNPSTSIEFSVKDNSRVRLEVIDILGRVVKTLTDDEMQAGTYSAAFNAQGMPSGIYFYKLTAPGVNIVKKMIFSK